MTVESIIITAMQDNQVARNEYKANPTEENKVKWTKAMEFCETLQETIEKIQALNP